MKAQGNALGKGWFVWVIAPKGPNKSAQGNALGKGRFVCVVALKGPNNLPATPLLRPFRAWSFFPSGSQGDALGFIVPAFQAEDRRVNKTLWGSPRTIPVLLPSTRTEGGLNPEVTMRVTLAFARERLELEIPDDRLIGRPRRPFPRWRTLSPRSVPRWNALSVPGPASCPDAG